MMNIFRKRLAELKGLNLPADKYAVFGSGPLAMNGIRDCEDMDIIVKPDLWDRLAEEYPKENDHLIRIGSIEVYKDWLPWFEDANPLIDDADLFEGIRFVRLKHVLEWKKAYGREKDKKDIQLIRKHMAKSRH